MVGAVFVDNHQGQKDVWITLNNTITLQFAALAPARNDVFYYVFIFI